MNTFVYYYLLSILAYLLLIVILYTLSIRFRIAGFLARLLASYATLLVCALYGVTVSVLLRLFNAQGLAQYLTARSFKYLMRYTTGVNFVVLDPNNYLSSTRPAVIIGNHQTELDVLMLGCVFPKWCSVTAKKSLKNVPFLGWFMSLSGTVFIDRANSSSARNAMSGAAKQMTEQKQSVYMFPEGTRSYSKEPMLLPFKKGAFHLALQAGVPIVPVVVANYADVCFVQGKKFEAGRVLCKGMFILEMRWSLPTSSN